MSEQRGVQSLLRHLCNLTKLLCETDYVQAFSRARAVVILFSFFSNMADRYSNVF